MDETRDSQRAPLKSQRIHKKSAYVPLIQNFYLYLYESSIIYLMIFYKIEHFQQKLNKPFSVSTITRN